MEIPEKLFDIEYQKGEIRFRKWKFVFEKKSDGFYDVSLYHKDFEDYIAMYKKFKNYDETYRYIVNFIENQLQ